MNAKSLIGMTVFSIEGGKNLGSVERLLFSPGERRVTSFVVTPAAGMLEEQGPQTILPVGKITSIGQDAITVESENLLQTTPTGELPAGHVAFDQIEKERVLTESGEEIGELSSLEFNEDDFRLESIEVSRGFLSGNNMISSDHIESIGEDVIVVKDNAAAPADDSTGRDEDDEGETVTEFTAES